MTDAASFVEHRQMLFGIAYRLLGSVSEAEDVVQDAYLRWQRVDTDTVDSPAAYLTTVVTRLAIDHLRSARVKREQYVGPWLPEPLVASDGIEAGAELADSLSTAFLVVLESLSPSERAAFVLREVFDYPYADVAEILDRSEAACRQLVHRAKEAVAARRPRFPASASQRERLTRRFLEACGTGDVEPLLGLLTEDATLVSDGGDKAKAAKRPIVGRDKVVRFLRGILPAAPPDAVAEMSWVNGGPGIVVRVDGTAFLVATLDCVGDAIAGVHLIVNPDKLHSVG